MSNQFILTPYFLDEPVPGLEPLVQPGWQINKVDFTASGKQPRMTQLHRPLADFVATAVSAGKRPVSVAGDCCTTIGVLAGLQRAGVNPTLVWLDAHGDFNTWETTPSGFLGGMPLAMLVGLGDQTMPQGVGLTSLPAAQVVFSDGRDLDPGERDLLEKSAVVHVKDVAKLIDALPEGPLYVHFDVDVLTSDEVPAMNYPVTGGPTAADLKPVFAALAQTGRVVAISVSSWNPDLDENGRSEAICMDLLHTLVG